MKLSTQAILLASAAVGVFALPSANNATYLNPTLPGWHSDPSCTRVKDTFFCATSTFETFPGLPVYASKDLTNWRLLSHAWNKESQLPGLSWNTSAQQQGMYAPTLRYHNGVFYLICEYLGTPGGIVGVVFKTTDPFDESAWSDPVRFNIGKIDPDIFWDDDGKVYMATQGIQLQELDLKTGSVTTPVSIWNGTGGVWPEGPHIYKKDGYYYLMIAEGGTAQDHSITIARAKKIYGPYEAYKNNPILTNRHTNRWFQTVGHGDLFQDEAGNWWGMCLATRSGPDYKIYPMGREAVLFPVTWNKGEWPVLQTVEGKMSGWPSLPAPSRDIDGDGPFNTDPDMYDFKSGDMPKNLIHFRVPRTGAFTIKNGLQVVPSRNNLTGIPFGPVELSGQRGLAFVGRRQTHTLFTYSVDLTFNPQSVGQEAGATIFLTQVNHIDLGVVLLNSTTTPTKSKGQLSLRFRVESQNVPIAVPATKVVSIPDTWKSAIRLQISTSNNVTYELSAMPADNPSAAIKMGTASAQLVTGGNGTFVGSLVGVYATCNGAGTGVECPAGGNAAFTRWMYTGKGQQVAQDTIVPEVGRS